MKNIKKVNFIIFSILISYIFTILFWNILNIENSLTPYLDDHNTNIEKYNDKYDEISFEIFSDLSTSITDYFKTKLDIGYDLLNLSFKVIGLEFEHFLFFSIFIAYIVYISIFLNISQCKSWIVYFILIIFSSFWMSFSLGSTVRQGLAMTFLIYFFFNSQNFTYVKALAIILIASTIHLSAILFIPYLIFEKIFLQRINLAHVIFIVITILYTLDLNFFISDIIINSANFLEFDLRALKEYKINHPTVGFSIYKLIATLIPVIFYIFSFFITPKNSFNILEKRIYLFYSFPAIIGMSLSQMSYYDRILLFSWTFSPILLTFSVYKFYPFFLKICKEYNIKKINL